MKLLVTGASGFVGRNFIKTYGNKYQIYTIVRENSNVCEIEKYCKIFRYDGNIENLKNYLNGIFANGGGGARAKFAESSADFGILHLATKYLSSHTPNDIKDLISANIIFGSEILESALIFKPKFFINILTFSQFANSISYNPVTFYDATKQAFYDIIQLYKDAFMESKFLNILLYNTYGKGDTRGKFLDLWHKISLNGKSLEMSEGAQKIDISHISDIVRALDLAIRNYQVLDSAKIYTFENHPRYTLKEIAEIFENITNRKLNILWGSKPYRKNEIFNPIAESSPDSANREKSIESSNFMKLPNYAPKITLKEGIRQTFT